MGLEYRYRHYFLWQKLCKGLRVPARGIQGQLLRMDEEIPAKRAEDHKRENEWDPDIKK